MIDRRTFLGTSAVLLATTALAAQTLLSGEAPRTSAERVWAKLGAPKS